MEADAGAGLAAREGEGWQGEWPRWFWEDDQGEAKLRWWYWGEGVRRDDKGGEWWLVYKLVGREWRRARKTDLDTSDFFLSCAEEHFQVNYENGWAWRPKWPRKTSAASTWW